MMPTPLDRQRARREKNRAAGLCPNCGQCPPARGYRHCMPCLTACTLPATRTHMALVRTALGSHVFAPEQPAPPHSQIAALDPHHPVCAVGEDDAEAPGPNLLACCSRWIVITTLPVTCGACGRVWLEEKVTV